MRYLTPAFHFDAKSLSAPKSPSKKPAFASFFTFLARRLTDLSGWCEQSTPARSSAAWQAPNRVSGFSWALLSYSGHPALRPSSQLRCSPMLPHAHAQAKEKCLTLCRMTKALFFRGAEPDSPSQRQPSSQIQQRRSNQNTCQQKSYHYHRRGEIDIPHGQLAAQRTQ
jgi:hypothetical protein